MAAAEYLLLFMDYDGTLVPLADHPSQATLAPRTKRMLQQLADQPGVRIALVSGRSLKELQRLVGLNTLCYVGNHGLEIADAQLHHVNPLAKAHRPLLQRVARQLRQALMPIPGAWVENKGLTVSVHYRCVSPQQAPAIKNAFYAAVRPYEAKRQVRVTTGKGVFELRPPVRWTKATVVRWLIARHTVRAASVLPLYVGDDLTDEDAFEALKNQGVTVAVGPSTPLTQAHYYVRTPGEVQRLLQRLLDARTPRPRAPHATATV